MHKQKHLNAFHTIWALIVLLALPCLAYAAEILVEETGLHDNALVVGVDATASSPSSNDDSIAVTAIGETDPSLYRNVSLSSVGIHFGPGGTSENSGVIDTKATGGNTEAEGFDYASAQATAYGIIADGGISNLGEIRAEAVGGNVYNSFGGGISDVEATGIYSLSRVENFGNVAAVALGNNAHPTEMGDGYSSSSATGIESYNIVDNHGDISVISEAGDAKGYRAFAHASAYGLSGKLSGELNNTGEINVISIGGHADANATQAGALSQAWGISSINEVNNLGNITVISKGGSASTSGPTNSLAYAYAYGIDTVLSVNNYSDISVSATGGDANAGNDGYANASAKATGISSNVKTENFGNIFVTSKGGKTTADNASSASAYAYGIIYYREIKNSGDITVNAIGGKAVEEGSVDSFAYAPSLAWGLLGDGIVENTGNITVTARAEEGFATAYGIYFSHIGSLTNTGIIRVTGDSAYEVYVAQGNATLLDTYNLTLDGDPAKASIYIGDTSTLDLNNATLGVVGIAGETRWDTPYHIFETAGSGRVDGSFGVVQPVNPNASVRYYDQGTANSGDDTVALAYAPTAAPALASAASLRQATTGAATIANNRTATLLLSDALGSGNQPVRLAAAETIVSDAGNGLFSSAPTASVYFEPYFSHLDNEQRSLGYEGKISGFVTGYHQRLDRSLLGVHLGYGRAGIDFAGIGFDANREDQDLFTLGLDAARRWDHWTLRFSATGFHGNHDYTGLSGAALDQRETAGYHSYGFYNSLMAGYLFRFGRQAVLPEIGLNHIWTHRGSYTSEVAEDPAWNTHFATLDDHEVQAEAKLRWLGDFSVGELSWRPSLAVGAKQFLTDAETSIHQSVSGSAPAQVETEQDETAATLSAALTLGRKSQTNITLAYDGEFSSDTRFDTVWLRLNLPF